MIQNSKRTGKFFECGSFHTTDGRNVNPGGLVQVQHFSRPGSRLEKLTYEKST